MDSGKIKTAVALLVMAGTGLFLYLSEHPRPPMPDPRVHEGIGQAMAEQAAQLAGNRGNIVLVARDVSVFPNPATDFQLRGFHRSLARAGLKVALTNRVRLDPLRVVRLPAGEFAECFGRLNEGDVVVSLLGPPSLSSAQRAQIEELRIAMVCLCPGDIPRQVDLRALFDQKLLRAAVVSRSAPGFSQPANDDPAAWFRQYYQVITPENLAELPPPVATLRP